MAGDVVTMNDRDIAREVLLPVWGMVVHHDAWTVRILPESLILWCFHYRGNRRHLWGDPTCRPDPGPVFEVDGLCCTVIALRVPREKISEVLDNLDAARLR